jgi:hypothetical protein
MARTSEPMWRRSILLSQAWSSDLVRAISLLFLSPATEFVGAADHGRLVVIAGHP